MLVLGANCNEFRHDYRHRLRRAYEPHVASRDLLIRFLVSTNREGDWRWRAREIAANGTVGAVDDLLFLAAATLSTMLDRADCRGHTTGSLKCFSDRTPYREAHCAHKAMGWWRTAGQWPSRW